jgi:trimethylamine---corrinoid protein Co-methyltransferase
MIKRNFTLQNILSQKDIEKIHESTIDILENTGVKLFNKKALKIFEERGAKIRDNVVYLNSLLVEDMLGKAPSCFELYARNPEKNITIGKGDIALAPGFGAPFVIENNGKKRKSTYDDYLKFTILASSSEYIDVLGGVLVEPNDIPEELKHLKMFFASAKYSDKCLMGSGLGGKKAA